MLPTYLFISNNVWYDFEKLVEEKGKEGFYWKKSIKRVQERDHIYFYLSGNPKLVKYEFEVIETGITNADITHDLEKYVVKKSVNNKPIKDDQPMIKIRLIRELTELDKIDMDALGEIGIRRPLMGARTLRPQQIIYFENVK